MVAKKDAKKTMFMTFFFFFVSLVKIGILNCMHHKRCLKMDANNNAKKTMFRTYFFLFFPCGKLSNNRKIKN